MSDTVLVIDDNQDYCEALCAELRRRGYAGRAAHSGAAGIASVRESPPRLIVLDLNLSDMSGMEVLSEIRRVTSTTDVVIATAFPELSSALGAIKQNAVDYLCKPFSFDELETVLCRVVGRAPAPPRRPEADAIPEMAGDSPATRELQSLVRRLAETGVRAALITGESGTGKDLVARRFHAQSRRRAGPFVEVNCSAIT